MEILAIIAVEISASLPPSAVSRKETLVFSRGPSKHNGYSYYAGSDLSISPSHQQQFYLLGSVHCAPYSPPRYFQAFIYICHPNRLLPRPLLSHPYTCLLPLGNAQSFNATFKSVERWVGGKWGRCEGGLIGSNSSPIHVSLTTKQQVCVR